MTGSHVLANAAASSQLLTCACTMQTMDPAKDVDGFHPLNVGRLLTRGSRPAFVPCTALGCMELLVRSGVDVRGKTAVILVRPLDEGFRQFRVRVTVSGSRVQGQGGLRMLAENDASDMPVLVSLSRNDLHLSMARHEDDHS